MGRTPLRVLVVGPGGRGRVSCRCRRRGQDGRHPGLSRISAATGSEI